MPSTVKHTLDEATAYAEVLKEQGKIHITLSGVTENDVRVVGHPKTAWRVFWQTPLPYQVEQLEGRTARCSCGQETPSRPDLFGFDYRGPDSQRAREICGTCKYSIVAHKGGSNYRPTRNTDVCEDFQPVGPAEIDFYYCGCRGWD